MNSYIQIKVFNLCKLTLDYQVSKYRITGLVPTSYGKKIYAFKYQDVRAIGTLKGKK